ncbi:MAG: universal stress protein [Halobacteriales archaeon]
MRYLVATDAVDTTAAACDYLEGRLDLGDAALVVTARGKGDPRYGADALNVAGVRLPGRDVETREVAGEPATAVLEAAAAEGADEIVIGASGGTPDAGEGLGSTAERILEGADRPVVVL